MRPRHLPPPGKNKRAQAQASLELALSLICIFLLLLGALKIFLWVNSRLVMRQEDYEKTRFAAGTIDPTMASRTGVSLVITFLYEGGPPPQKKWGLDEIAYFCNQSEAERELNYPWGIKQLTLINEQDGTPPETTNITTPGDIDKFCKSDRVRTLKVNPTIIRGTDESKYPKLDIFGNTAPYIPEGER